MITSLARASRSSGAYGSTGQCRIELETVSHCTLQLHLVVVISGVNADDRLGGALDSEFSVRKLIKVAA